MSLYLWLDLLAISIPIILSFEKNLLYYKRWPFLFSAIFLTMIPFVAWDIFFTHRGYWGFNSEYLVGLKILELPIEELLFFIVVPYASLFAYYAIRFHFPRYKVQDNALPWITGSLILLALFLTATHFDRIYAVLSFTAFIAVMVYGYFKFQESLAAFLAIFPVILIPFFIMNGILTGTGIEDEIVWYNESAFMGVRMGTIPFEDMFYGFTLIFLALILTEKLEQTWRTKK